MTKYVGWIALVVVGALVFIFWKQIEAFFSPSMEGKPCTISGVNGTYKRDGVSGIQCIANSPVEGSACMLQGNPGSIINGACVINATAQRVILPPSNLIVNKSTRLPYFYGGCRYGNAISYGRPSSPFMQIFRISCS